MGLVKEIENSEEIEVDLKKIEENLIHIEIIIIITITVFINLEIEKKIVLLVAVHLLLVRLHQVDLAEKVDLDLINIKTINQININILHLDRNSFLFQ